MDSSGLGYSCEIQWVPTNRGAAGHVDDSSTADRGKCLNLVDDILEVLRGDVVETAVGVLAE